MTIAPADLFRPPSGEVSGEVDIVEFGPFTVSFGVWAYIDTIQWIRIRSDEGIGQIFPDEGVASIPINSDDFVVGANVDQVNMGVTKPYLIPSQGETHFIRIERTWFLGGRAVTELTFFTSTNDKPRFHRYSGDRVYDPVDPPPTCNTGLECFIPPPQ
jgi:hypothetical protein